MTIDLFHMYVNTADFQRARSEEQRENRRQAILDTAAAMLEEMSVGALSLNELSRRVGLAKSNVLRCFESREAILLALLDRDWREWNAVLTERLAAAVTPDVAARCKRAALKNVTALAGLARQHLPELGGRADEFCAQAVMVSGAVWTHARPSAAMLTAYEGDSSFAALRMDFTTTLQEMLTTLIAGPLSRAEHRSPSFLRRGSRWQRQGVVTPPPTETASPLPMASASPRPTPQGSDTDTWPTLSLMACFSSPPSSPVR
jgi:AcrR family transcriptional regulator